MNPSDNSLDSSLDGPSTGYVSDPTQSNLSPRARGMLQLFKFHGQWVPLLVLCAIIVIGAIGIVGWVLTKSDSSAKQSASSKDVSGNFGVSTISLEGVTPADELQLTKVDNLTLNGQLTANNGVVLTPTTQPSSPVAGEVYFDANTNQPYYYNGTSFVPFGQKIDKYVSTLGGASGAIGLSSNLRITNGQLDLSNTFLQSVNGQNQYVTTLQGKTGNVTLSAGNGISISGTTIKNTGVTSVKSSDGSIVVTTGSNGAVDIKAVQGGPGSTAVLIGPVGAQLDSSTNSSININKTGASGNLVELAVGGTDKFVVDHSGTVTVGTIGWNNVTGKPIIVNSLNGQAGALTLSNTTASGSTLTINDAKADGATKGIATFNGTNFSAAGGVVNTAQGISITATPTFGGLTLNGGLTITAGGVNVTGASSFAGNVSQSGASTFTTGTGAVQLNGNTSVSGANTFTVGTGAVSLGGTLGVTGSTTLAGLTVGNITQSGASTFTSGTGAVQLNGNTSVSGSNTFTVGTGATSLGGSLGVTGNTTLSGTLGVTGAATLGSTLAVQGASVTVGGAALQGSLILNDGAGKTGSLLVDGLAQNTVYHLPDPGAASDTICLVTLNNCANAGGATYSGTGNSGYLAKFTSDKNITQSLLYDDGTGLGIGTTTPGAFLLNVQGGNVNFGGTATVGTGLTVSAGGVAVTGNSTIAGTLSGLLGLTVASGGASITGNATIAGTLSGLTALTSAGTITFSDLNTAGVLHTDASGVLSTSAVVLGTDTSGSYVSALGSLTGLTTTGNTGAGSTPTLAVTYGSLVNTSVQGNTTLDVAAGTGLAGGGTITLGTGGTATLNVQYGSAAGTAVEGNTTLICPSGAGNLTGGGTSITLGSGGTCGSLDVVSSPSFSGSVTAGTGLTVTAGGANITGDTTIAGTLGSLTGLTSSGTITFGGLNTVGVVHTDASGVLSTGAVALGTDTTGNYVSALGSLTGLTTTGNTGAGSTPTLAVTYGSAASTAVQGNTQVTLTAGAGLSGGGTITLGSGGSASFAVQYGSSVNTAAQGSVTFTCPSGTGNLTGGGDTITIGAGGTCGNLDVVNSPTFSGTLAVQGATLTVGTATQQGALVLNAGNTFTGKVQADGTLTQNITYTLPDPSSKSVNSDTICLLTLANCAGAGTGVTASSPGTNNTIAMFTGNQTIADSTLTQSGTTVTASGNVVIQGANSLTLGVSSTSNGSVAFNNSLGTHSVALQAPSSDPAANLVFKLPSAYGSNGSCLISDGTGGLAFQSCTGGAGGGVTSVDGQTGTLTIANSTGSAGTITLSDAKADGATKGIATFTASQFSAVGGVISLDTVAVGNGGTGLSTAPGNGQLLIGNGTGYTLANLTNSDGTVTISNGPGSIEISVPRANQCSTCADYTLDNLSDVIAINKSLLPASAGTIDLGGAAVSYRYLYLAGDSATPGSNYFKITGTATSPHTITLPDAGGTVCLNSNNCGYVNLQPGTPGSAQSGNINVDGTIIAGTNLTSSGTLSVTGASTLSGGLTTNSITSTGASDLTIAPSATHALIIGATGASQSTLIQGNALSFKSGNGANAITYTLGTTKETAGNSYELCDTSGNCAGSGGGVTTTGGTSGTLPIFNASQTLINSVITQDSATSPTKVTVGKDLYVTGNINGSAALTVASTGAGNALTLNSGSGIILLGGSTSTIQRAGTPLVLDANSASTSTVQITNSNASNVANLSVEGGVNIGSGQAYKINGTDINTAGTLGNVAYLNQANTFTANQSITGTLGVSSTINGQTISSAANFTGTAAIQGGWNGTTGSSLTLGTASSATGAIVFNSLGGANGVTLKASDTNPAASFTLTLPSAIGNSGDCLKQTDASGGLGFVSCSSGLGGSGTAGTIPVFTGGTAIGDSLLTQPNATTVALQGASNALSVDGAINVGVNGATGNAGVVNFLSGGNPGVAVGVKAQDSGSSYTLELPTSADAGTTCLTLVNVGAGVNKITGGSCAAGGTGGNVTASGTTNGYLARFTSDGPSYSVAASLIRDNGSGIGVNVAPQAGYVLTVGSTSKFNVTDGGQLEIGTTGSNPLTISTVGNITNVVGITASGLLQTSANGQALGLTGAPTTSATQSLLRLGGAISGGNANGTYLGINAPAAGNGSAADFINLQANSSSKFKVDINGNVTGGTFNGVTLNSNGTITANGHTLTLSGNSSLDQNLLTTSDVQFNSITLATKLGVAQGGSGADLSGALAGSTMIFNATTGKFEANKLTSSDNSVTVTSSDGSIDLKVASCSSCAKTDLSNLGTTDINASLLAQTGVDLGSGSQAFRNLYLYGGSATPGSASYEITGTPTANRLITLPDAGGTVCLDSNNCKYVTLQSGTPSAQTGSLDVSGSVIAGTDLNSAGTLTVTGMSTLTGGLTVATISAPAATALAINPASGQGITIGATGASQTTLIQGNGISFKNGNGANAINFTFDTSKETAGGSYNICDTSGNCAGAGGGITGSGSNNQLAKFTGTGTIASSIIGDDGTTASVAGNFAVNATTTAGSSVAYSNTSLNANGSNLESLSFKNANSTATSTTVNGLNINASGTAGGTNIINGINLSNVSTLGGNTFNAIVLGTGYNSLLSYNGNALIDGSGLLQNVAISSSTTYSNLQKVGALSTGSIVSGFGTISINNDITTSTALQGGTLAAGSSSQFGVDASGNVTTSGTLAVNGSILSSTASSFTLLSAPTTVNAFGAATQINLAGAVGAAATVLNLGQSNGNGTVTLNSNGVLALNTTSSPTVASSITVQPGTYGASDGTGAALTLKAGDENGGGTTTTGGSVTIQAGNATGGATSRIGGGITLDAGTGTTNGTISIGHTNASAITMGRLGVLTHQFGQLQVDQLLTGNAGATIGGAAINLNASSNNTTNINTGTSTGAVNIGNGSAGAINLQSGAAINLTANGNSTLNFGTGNNLAITSLNFAVTSAGVVTVAGGQAADLTTPAVPAGTATSLTAQPGSSGVASGTGASLNLKGGNQTGTSGTGGSVNISGGTGTTTGSVVLQGSGGNVGIGASTPGYQLDLRGNAASQLHLTSTALDGDAYLLGGFGGLFTSANAAWNGGQWVAKAATATILQQQNGTLTFQSDTGLTGGSTYTPTARFSVDGSGNGTFTGNLAVNGSNLTSTQATFNLLNANPTTINAFGKSTAINIASSVGASATIVSVGSTGGATLQAGNAANPGALALTTASPTAGTAGNVSVQPGSSNTASGTGASANITGGNQTGTTSTGGSVNIDAGTGTSNNGNINIGITNAKNINLGNSTATTVASFTAGAYGLKITNTGVGIGLGAGTPTRDLQFGAGADRIFDVAAQTAVNTAGNNLTIRAATGNGTGNGGNLVLQGGAKGASGTAAGYVAVKANGTDGIAFQIQNNAGAFLMSADTSAAVIKVGNTGTQNFTATGNGDLYVTGAVGISGRLLVGTTTNGIDTNGGQLRYTGSYQNTKKISLTAEYAGATLDATADCTSANSGTMISGYDSTNRRNFYDWTSTQTSANCYDVVVQVPVPSDWAGWTGTPTIDVYSDNTTNATGAVDVLASDGFQEATSFGTNITPASASTWSSKNLPSLTNAHYSAGSYFTIRIRMSAQNSANLRIGNITIPYLSQF